MANEKGTPALRSQVLLCPVTDANFDTPPQATSEQLKSLTQGLNSRACRRRRS
ncbi:MAG: hypothetical protein ABIQ08_06470 [Duganella sp.]